MMGKTAGIWVLVFVLAFAAFAEMARAASPKMGKGRFAGMILIPAGPFTMGRNDGPMRKNPRTACFFPPFTSTRTW